MRQFLHSNCSQTLKHDRLDNRWTDSKNNLNDNDLKILIQYTGFLADIQFIQILFELFGSLALPVEKELEQNLQAARTSFSPKTWPTKFYFNYRVSKDNPSADEFWGNRDDVRSSVVQSRNSRSSFVKKRSRRKVSKGANLSCKNIIKKRHVQIHNIYLNTINSDSLESEII